MKSEFQMLNKLAFALSLIIMAIFPIFANAEKAEYSATQAHAAITSETEWLNTSRAITAEDLAGRIILVDFWTFCCINCIHVIPDLQALEKEFGADLTVIGVHSAKFANEKDKENIRSAVLRYGIEHAVVNDADFKIWKQFAVRSWPTLILIGADGKIKQTYSGEGNKEEIRDDIKSLLREAHNKEPLPIELEKDKEPETLLSFPGKMEFGSYQGEAAIFIANSAKNQIIIANSDGKIINTLQGDFNNPQGLLYNKNSLYVADTGNHKLKRIDLNSGEISTLAGTGERGGYHQPGGIEASKVALASPWDLALYPDENHITIANAGSHQLWTYNLTSERLDILAGNGRESIDDGEYPYNSLSQPSGLSVADDKLYFVDSETSSLRVLQDGRVKTLIGTGLFDFGYNEGGYGKGLLQHPLGVEVVGNTVFIADSYNHSIRKYNLETKKLQNFLGDGKRGVLNEPNDIKFHNGKLYILDTNNNRIMLNDGVELDEFFLREKLMEQKPMISENLPNLVDSKPITINNMPKIVISLPENWKINELAPSFLNIYKDNKLVESLPYEMLKDLNTVTKELENGEYLMQGTIYYCADEVNAICLLASVNKKLKVEAKSESGEIKLLFPKDLR